jgi:hypothetical protein
MKSLSIAALLAAGLLVCGGAVRCAEPRAVGMAVFVKGDVKLKRPWASETTPLKQRDNLYLGDIVETGPDGSASLVMLYGSEIRLNENTLLEFIPGKKKGDIAKLLRGQVWTRMLHKRGGLQIRTIGAICAVRGTEADIEQLEALTVKVYEGRVDVENTAGKVSLKAGEMTLVAGPASAPAKAVKMKPADFGRWQEGITSPAIIKFLEELRAAQGEKKLRFNVGGQGKEDKDVRIKLKKKAGTEEGKQEEEREEK